MGFQKQVNLNLAPAKVGDRASMNPVQTVDAGPGGLVAGSTGVTVGRFAWNTYATAGGPGTAGNNSTVAPTLPAGFIANEQQAMITIFLDDVSLVVPEGLPVTEYDRGDFWAKSTYSEAAIGNKVFANLFSGEVLAAATGSFPTNDAGSATSITASGTIGTFDLVVSAIAASGILAKGMLVTGSGIPANTFIDAQSAGSTGVTGTYTLTQKLTATITAATITIASPEGIGGAVVASATASTGSTTLNIITITSGMIAAGQYIKGTGIATGAYIASLGTFNGVSGTVELSAVTTATITTAAVNTSSWIETPWSVKSAGNVGDLIKIGIKN